MKYEGKLYGKVGKHYFPLEATSDDVDNLMALLKEARDLLVLCSLIDKSGQCMELVNKIDDIQEKGDADK
jgi:hypothetical protein